MKMTMIDTNGVARELGLTSARVRQMVDERKLPEPVALGLRAHLWIRSHIELIARGQRHTLFFEELRIPDDTLELCVDCVTYIDVDRLSCDRWAGPRARRTAVDESIHVQAYQADDYEVVVIGFPDARRRTTVPTDSEIVETVMPMVEATPERTQWVFRIPCAESWPGSDDMIRTATFRLPDWDAVPLASFDGEPYFAVNDLTEKLGRTPLWYPPSDYSTGAIHRWQRWRGEPGSEAVTGSR